MLRVYLRRRLYHAKALPITWGSRHQGQRKVKTIRFRVWNCNSYGKRLVDGQLGAKTLRCGGLIFTVLREISLHYVHLNSLVSLKVTSLSCCVAFSWIYHFWRVGQLLSICSRLIPWWSVSSAASNDTGVTCLSVMEVQAVVWCVVRIDSYHQLVTLKNKNYFRAWLQLLAAPCFAFHGLCCISDSVLLENLPSGLFIS